MRSTWGFKRLFGSTAATCDCAFGIHAWIVLRSWAIQLGEERNLFRVLGPLEIVVGGRIVDLPAPKHRAFLAGLLISSPRGASLDRLVRWAWDDDLPENPRAALHTYVRRVRRQLGDYHLVATTPDGYRRNVAPDDVDLFRFP